MPTLLCLRQLLDLKKGQGHTHVSQCEALDYCIQVLKHRHTGKKIMDKVFAS